MGIYIHIFPQRRKRMNMTVFTHAMASYGLYKAMPKIKEHYNYMGSLKSNRNQRKIYNFIHTHIEPTSYSSKKLLKGIRKYQWLSHLIYFIGAAYGGFYDKTAINYLGISLGVPLVIQAGKHLTVCECIDTATQKAKSIGTLFWAYYQARQFEKLMDQIIN